MAKKEYIIPEIENLELDHIHLLAGTDKEEGKGEGELEGDDVGAKAWGGDLFNLDEEE